MTSLSSKHGYRLTSLEKGYLVAAGWQFSIVSTSFLAGTIIQGLLVLNYPSYDFQRWHGTLLVWAVALFSVFFNIFLAKRLPIVEWILLIIYILGFFAIIVPLWVLAPRANAHAVFTEFTNAGGWTSTGTAFMIGLSGIIASLAGYDCVVHMAEEIEDASATLPQALLSGVALNGVMGLIMVITICFTLGNVNDILSTPTKYPFIQVLYNATQDYAGANALTAIIIIVFTSAVSQVYDTIINQNCVPMT